jgi:hypothetical protein
MTISYSTGLSTDTETKNCHTPATFTRSYMYVSISNVFPDLVKHVRVMTSFNGHNNQQKVIAFLGRY